MTTTYTYNARYALKVSLTFAVVMHTAVLVMGIPLLGMANARWTIAHLVGMLLNIGILACLIYAVFSFQFVTVRISKKRVLIDRMCRLRAVKAVPLDDISDIKVTWRTNTKKIHINRISGGHVSFAYWGVSDPEHLIQNLNQYALNKKG